MVVDDLFSVIHAAATDFDCVTIKDSSKFMVCQEVLLSTRVKNLCPILVLTFLLNGGLYQSTLFRGLFFYFLVVGCS